MPIRNEKGTTLVEVLAATIVLGIVVTAFLNLSHYTLFANQKSSAAVEARHIAEEQLNVARALIAANPAASLTNPTVPGFTVLLQLSNYGTAPPETPGLPPNRFSMQAVVMHGHAPKMLTVTVAWDGS